MLEILHEPNAMVALRSEWDALALRFKSVFLSYDWFAACAQVLAPSDRLAILVSRDQGGAVDAIAPLVESDTPKGPALEILGSVLLGEPSGLLYRDTTALAGLLDGLVELGTPVTLRRLHAKSAEAELFARTSKTRAVVSEWSGGDSAWLPIAGTWEGYQSALSSGRRTDLRRKLRRTERRGKVEIAFSAPSIDGLSPLLHTAFEVEAKSWKGADGTAILQSPAQRRFFESYCASAARLGQLRAGFLQVAGKPAAMLLGVAAHDAFWALKMGYDEAYGECSPGVLLNHASIAYAFSQHLGRYEFCGWSEPWQSSFTERRHPYVSSTLYPLSARGLRALGTDLPRFAVRSLRNLIKSA